MDIAMTGPDGRHHSLTSAPLRIDYNPTIDLFEAVAGGNDALARDPHADALHVRTLRFLIAANGVIVGFQIIEFSSFEPEEGNADLLYTPRFSAPGLGLDDASAGEIIEAAQRTYCA